MNIKSIDKFLTSKFMKDNLKIAITNQIKNEVMNFHNKIGVNYDRRQVICDWINFGFTDFVDRWETMRSFHNATKDYLTLRYGESLGMEKYISLNSKKTKSFPNTKQHWINSELSNDEINFQIHNIQKQRAENHDNYFPSQTQFWIRKGFTEEEALLKVSEHQSRGLSFFINKYGENDGVIKHKQRNNQWVNTLTSKNDYSDICWKKGLGVEQYKQKYGEELGLQKYKECRLKHAGKSNKFGKPSNESKKFLENIISWCETNNLQYQWGFNDKEFYIQSTSGKIYYCDFFIPSLKIIIEYNGESFHPNPKYQGSNIWNNWKLPFNYDITADIKFDLDNQKYDTILKNRYYLIIIWSSDVIEGFETILLSTLDGIKSNLYSS